MNLLCPHCQQTIAIADQYAGQLMKCPLCANTFTAPSLPTPSHPPVTPAPSATAAAPSMSSSTAAGAVSELAAGTTPAMTPAATGGYSRTATFWISPRVVPWIGPAALLLILVLTFFAWLRVYDTPSNEVTSNNAWGLAFLHPINTLSLFYLLFLLIGVISGIAALILPRTTVRVPPAIRQLLPWSSGILLTITTMGLVFLLLQLLTDFKQETDVRVLPINSMHTIALKAAVLLQVIAVISYALEFWLAVRKSKPMPRMDVRW